MSDWVAFLKSKEDEIGDELDLSQLAVGDFVRIVTGHTEYTLRMVGPREADLISSRADRPRGRVSIMGCTFGASSSIKPDYLFCGGNLELTYALNGIAMTHTTTAIREIHWRRQRSS